MKSVLTKISAPLLVGSILALGALAYPGHADAGEARFIFRLKAATVERPTVVADNGDKEGGTGGTGMPGGGSETSTGEDGDGTGTPSGGDGDAAGSGTGGTAQRQLVMTYGSYMLRCATDWTVDFVEAHRPALTTAPGSRNPAYLSIRRSENGGVGTITVRNSWFDLVKGEYVAQAFPAVFPQVWVWAKPGNSKDPHPSAGPCLGDVTVDGPALTSANGSTTSTNLTSIEVR